MFNSLPWSPCSPSEQAVTSSEKKTMMQFDLYTDIEQVSLFCSENSNDCVSEFFRFNLEHARNWFRFSDHHRIDGSVIRWKETGKLNFHRPCPQGQDFIWPGTIVGGGRWGDFFFTWVHSANVEQCHGCLSTGRSWVQSPLLLIVFLREVSVEKVLMDQLISRNRQKAASK